MATPRSIFAVVLLAFIPSSVSALRPESSVQQTISEEGQGSEQGPCPQDQALWVLLKKDDKAGHGEQREHCLPTIFGMVDGMPRPEPAPRVRETGRWCCNPLEKAEGKVCRKACLYHPGPRKQVCVPFCEDPNFEIRLPKLEKNCAEGEEVYRSYWTHSDGVFNRRHHDRQDWGHYHCLPRRLNIESAKPLVEAKSVKEGDRGCCKGHPQGMVCYRALFPGHHRAGDFCEYPKFAGGLEPVRGCPLNMDCPKECRRIETTDKILRHRQMLPSGQFLSEVAPKYYGDWVACKYKTPDADFLWPSSI